MASITSLSFHIFAHYHGTPAMTAARRDLTDAQKSLKKTSDLSNKLAAKFHVLQTAAVALTPALVPIAAQLLATSGGFIAASAAAGAAGGIWGIALKGAISQTMKAKKETDKLKKTLDSQKATLAQLKPGTKAYNKELIQVHQTQQLYNASLKAFSGPQKRFVAAQSHMSAAWTTFINATSGSTLGPATIATNALAGSMHKFVPVVKAVEPVATRVAVAFRNWTTNGGLDRAVRIITQYGVPALGKFVRITRSVLGVLGIGFRQFLPTGMRVVTQLSKGADALKRWSQGGGFIRFLGYVKGNGPAVHQFFKAFMQALTHISKAIKDVAPLSLMLATGLLQMIAAIPPSVLMAIWQAFVLWRAAILSLLIINTLIKAVKTARIVFLQLRFVMLLFPGLWIVLAIGAVIAAIVLIATKTTWFQTAWHATWGLVKRVANDVWGFLGGKWKWLILLIGPIGWLLFLLRNWRMVWNGIRTATLAAWNAVLNHVFLPIGRFFTQTIPRWSGMVARDVSGAWKLIARNVTSWYHSVVRNVFSPIGRFFTSTIPRWSGMVARSVTASWRALVRGCQLAYNSVVRNVFSPIGRFFTKTIPHWGDVLRSAVVRGFKNMVNGIKGQWDKLIGIGKAPVRFFVNTVYNKGLRSAWNNTAGKIPGVPDLPAAHLPFASGGYVRGAGTGTSDSIAARLSHGEYVISSRAVQQIGVNNLNRLNSMGASSAARGRPSVQPGFALGGFVIPNPITALKNAGQKTWGALKWGADVIKSVGSKALGAMFNPIKGLMRSVTKKFPGAGILGTAIKNNGLRAIPAMLKYAISFMMDGGGAGVGKALSWARSQVGKRYQWGGNGNPSWDCSGFMSAIESVIRGQRPHRRWSTHAFSGSHGPPGWKRNLKSPFMIGVTNAGVGHTAGTLGGVNVECSGGPGVRVGGGARGYNNRMFTSRWGFEGAMGGNAGGSAGKAQNYAKSIMGRYGWGMQYWPALNNLWQRESGWKYNARNPSSGAYGIPQALPPLKMSSVAGDWRTNPATQIKWGMGYIRSVYGNPNVAWKKWQARKPHWYSRGGPVPMVFDKGGYLPKGISLVNNKTGKPEPLRRADHGDDKPGVEFRDCTFIGTSKSEWSDIFVKSYKEAKRKKRVP